MPASFICFARFDGRWFSSASMAVVSAVSRHARNDLRQLVPPGGLSVVARDALVLGGTVAELPWRTVQCARTDIAAAARSSVISCVRWRQRRLLALASCPHAQWQAGSRQACSAGHSGHTDLELGGKQRGGRGRESVFAVV